MSLLVFLFNDPATTEIYTLSLHDALPIFDAVVGQHRARRRVDEQPGRPRHDQVAVRDAAAEQRVLRGGLLVHVDRKSTRLNSSHGYISYAVFCLKKKKKKQESRRTYA